ncbi:hypothetical protein NDU88_006467 [Pleurodeles waltl]|uniref:Uncharacterized protein n=1 Tax=Pleurodeles waltl TaxID=8319 RepID=A0AAV7SPM2_PLEWA|nr:hypothetical protein NDU88_006467 [Pleurodeles waltl]
MRTAFRACILSRENRSRRPLGVGSGVWAPPDLAQTPLRGLGVLRAGGRRAQRRVRQGLSPPSRVGLNVSRPPMGTQPAIRQEGPRVGHLLMIPPPDTDFTLGVGGKSSVSEQTASRSRLHQFKGTETN